MEYQPIEENRMNFMKKIRKFRRETRAISPVIATLLMIAIAVVASLVTYAWVMGYMNFQTNKTGNAIQIQSVSLDGTVYVQNVGTGSVSFKDICLHIDGAGVSSTTITSTPLAEGGTMTIKSNAATSPFQQGSHTYTIKVTCEQGTYSEVTKNFPL
jgi:archaeal type IV pilus assembly protein PilA